MMVQYHINPQLFPVNIQGLVQRCELAQKEIKNRLQEVDVRLPERMKLFECQNMGVGHTAKLRFRIEIDLPGSGAMVLYNRVFDDEHYSLPTAAQIVHGFMDETERGDETDYFACSRLGAEIKSGLKIGSRFIESQRTEAKGLKGIKI